MIKQIPSNKIKDFIKENPKSILLDVRTKEEWDQIGKPDGDKIGIKTYFLSSQLQGRIINENFSKLFKNSAQKVEILNHSLGIILNHEPLLRNKCQILPKAAFS